MVLAVVIFWVILGLAVFLIAMGRGQRNAPATESRAAVRLTLIGVTALFGFGIIVPAVVLFDNGKHHASAAPGGVSLTAAQQHGRYLFGQACNVCHTLQASEAVGKTGPNLDILRPPSALVLNAIETGRARGNGNMPQGLYTGVDARDVASYVAAVAGHG